MNLDDVATAPGTIELHENVIVDELIGNVLQEKIINTLERR